MEKLVRFRMLSSALSLDEYRGLLSSVLDENTMQAFSSMIFNHCLKQLKTQNERNDVLQIDMVNQTITDIVLQRKFNQTSLNAKADESDDESNSHQPLNITDCADNIIQEIASYLPSKSYSIFQCCCRSIFYAANSPSSLYAFDGWRVDLSKGFDADNTHQIQLFMKRFERIQQLRVITCDTNKKYIRMIRFRNLKHLRLNPSADDLELYLSQNIFNFDSITHLDIAYFENAQHLSPLEIIKRCKNLRSLEISGLHVWDDVTVNDGDLSLTEQFQNLECLPNLYHFDMDCSESVIDTNTILKSMCNTLRSLMIWNPERQHVEGVAFNNLVELGLQSPTPKGIISAIRTTKHLQRLKLFFLLWDESYHLAFENIFELNTLESLYIQCGEDSEVQTVVETIQFSQLIRWIELSLTSLHRQRDMLKLELNCVDLSIQPEHINEAIVRMWNAVSSCHTRHFMLIYTFARASQRVDSIALNEYLDSISWAFSVDRNLPGKIVIANKLSPFIINHVPYYHSNS
eukprot:257577_1